MLFYYITDRRQFPGSAGEQRATLLRKISEAAHAGVDYIQLREKDLSARELLQLAVQARQTIAQSQGGGFESGKAQFGTRLLINSRLDVALAAAADGVHLRSDDISAADARVIRSNSAVMREARPGTAEFLIACSCHSAEEVRRAESDGADFVVFAPVFEKGGQHGVGLEVLRAAARGTERGQSPEPSAAVHIPVLALGGITVENARACLDAGAAGVAGIRLFQDNDVAEVVRKLRKLAAK